MRQFRIHISKGVFLEGDTTNILIDPLVLPSKRPDLVLVSHAHSDHYTPGVLRRISSTGVRILMSTASRMIIDPKKRLKNVVEINPGEKIESEKFTVEAFDAGHIIGSLQFRIELADVTFVYTGDFNLEKRIILEPAKPLSSDVLLIDATYGLPIYVFPKRQEIYSQLLSLVREKGSDREIALKARKLGVAQEVTALLSMATDLPVLVEPEIAVYNEIYEKFGEILGRYAINNNPSRGAPFVARLSRKFPRGIQSIPLTGWAMKSGIPLSSHGDFKQIIDYVRRSSPDIVIPVCGFREELSSYLLGEHGFSTANGEEIILNL
ncbi:MAG: MBL fold metallo-hydrolase [Infirmifilum sp.]